jgi:hypothetical protein
MKCPKCGTDYVCPCKSCAERNKDKKPWPWGPDDLQSCAGCGFTQHVDQWLDEDVRQMKEANGGQWPS